ncbi:uncharacterized protein [Temnothorax longispinosus]|uniref:uncharacterized protein n=1 Tax=Temnothorax longispinosus TaxID=300112 RepID=UPI003A9A50C3
MEIDNNSTNAELSNQKNGDILEKIAILKIYVSMLETTIKALKFGRSQLANIQSKLSSNGAMMSDVQSRRNWSTELCRDISQFTGMPCIKIEQNSKFVFEMSNSKDIAKKGLYAIEILIDDDGHGKLGKCVLPNFIDVRNMLSQYRIDNLNNVKHFLKSCKHHIDCYFSRLKQADEVKKLFLEAEHAYICYNSDVSLIELTMLGIRDINITKLYDIILYLHYNLDETRPYKLSTTVDESEIASPTLIRRFNKYFESFLKMDLTSALLQLSEFQNEFAWDIFVEQDDEDDIEIYDDDSDDENTGIMIQYLYRGDNLTRSNRNEAQNDSMENGNEELALDENEMET